MRGDQLSFLSGSAEILTKALQLDQASGQEVVAQQRTRPYAFRYESPSVKPAIPLVLFLLLGDLKRNFPTKSAFGRSAGVPQILLRKSEFLLWGTL
jgi:hypothetical protein